MFEPEVFRKQMYCIEESSLLVTLLGLSGAPHSDSDPGKLLALPRYAPVLRAEFSKSRSDLTFVAMSLTSTGERQFSLFNKAHKNIKNILFSSMSWQRRE